MTQEQLDELGRSATSPYAPSWWKAVVLGAVMIVAVVVGAAVGIDAWFLGLFALILGFLLIAVGLTLGLADLLFR